MKTFLLIVTILLFIGTISSTERNLSEKAYKKYAERMAKSNTDLYYRKSKDDLKEYKFVFYLIATIYSMFLLWYFLYIGHIFSNKILYFTSILQTSMVLVTGWKDLIKKNPFSTNPEDFKFDRWFELFNVVLDYVYYPAVIGLLLR